MISICIPTYEQTEHLDTLLESIVKQDFNNYEVVVSDDSKTNAVKTLIIDKYEPLLGDKLRYYHNVPAMGSPANWNNAIKLAKFDIVKIMHHDDYFSSKDSLSKIINQFSLNPDVSVVFCGGYTIAGSEIRNHTTSEFNFKKIFFHPVQLYENNLLGSPSTLCFRNYKGLFDIRLKWLVDVDFYYTLFKRKLKTVFLNEPLVTCVMGSHNLSNELENNAECEIYEHKVVFDKIKYNFVEKHFLLILLAKKMRKHGVYSTKELMNVLKEDSRIDLWFHVAILLNKIYYKINN